MAEKPRLLPGPEHPITIKASTDRVVVTVAGKVVADTRNALVLQEANYPPVRYLPLTDVDESLLSRSETSSYCPYKGDAGYYSIPVGGDKSVDALWEYTAPFDAVAPIVNHVAFYPDRVDSIEVTLA
ncbi:uncharacterized protein (DUF427 family) [Actinoplanes lutulentus]|uniref:Uncharacterized protein (DUF427 family) n=1 Tax=Actinoplanes lutulentus TaxID=1287878 RepID=A0A327Z5F4_9ACTN|nr:DUF427 domain-containing protein [Actinoplanes lutulentus]MBB2948626.1 uncharacterized protein (DUF427 family) [Actinoplanes lutulentus]RAK28003.1 uncharacterized protein (DUF427 family) [Actinoplanes lutulentus]